LSGAGEWGVDVGAFWAWAGHAKAALTVSASIIILLKVQIDGLRSRKGRLQRPWASVSTWGRKAQVKGIGQV
jgi:hypothetical protein